MDRMPVRTRSSSQAASMWGRVRPDSMSSSITSSSCSTAVDGPLDALGIAKGPAKYEIHGGKMVPQAARDIDRSHDDPIVSSLGDSIHQATRQRLQRELLLQQPPSPRKSWLKRSSGWRPASSVYSDAGDSCIGLVPRPLLLPSSRPTHDRAARAHVSPPSSPEPAPKGPHRHVAAAPASPVEAESLVAVSHQAKAHRAAHQAMLPPAANAHVRARSNTTTPPRDHGPPRSSPTAAAHASPGSNRAPARVPPSHPRSRGRAASNDGSGGGSDGGSADAAARLVDARSPRKAVSNRCNIFPFLDNDLYVAPLTFRRESPSKRPGGALFSHPETNHDGAATTSLQRSAPLALNLQDAPASKPSAAPAHTDQAPPDSMVPVRAPRRRPRSPPPPPPLSPSLSFTNHQPSSHFTTPHSLTVDAPRPSTASIKRKPAPPAAVRQDQSRITRSQNPVVRDTARPVHSTSDTAWEPPSSRFSVTTCATSIQDTPRQSALPRVPALSPQSYSSSVSDRSESQSDDASLRSSTGTIAVSPGNLYSTVNGAQPPLERRQDRTPRTFPTMDTQSIDSRSSILSMDKPLPLAPPELSASHDRIAQLDAYIHSLTHRRLNINRSIQQMTELMPSDSLFASDDVLRKREAEKSKVQALRNEMAEIQREEYDAGLKLHRAYKRVERDAEYEQTALWVRRVTS